MMNYQEITALTKGDRIEVFHEGQWKKATF